MKIRFLLDENMSKDIVTALLRYNPEIDVLRIGSPGAPPLGTLDPDILRFCEAEHRALVTDNRSSMPQHVADLWSAGGQHWGVLKTRSNDIAVGATTSQLILMWEASEAEEYINHDEWIPW